MINLLKIATFSLVIALSIAANVFSQAAQYRLGVAHGSSLYSNKEQFEFALPDGQKIVLNSTNPVVYFNTKFNPGQKYTITQTAGPRNCNLFGMNQGAFTNQDILVSADCGNPPLSIFKLQIIGVEQGETFKFADNYRRSFQYPFSTTANLGGYPQGDDYAITQTGGPRACRMTNNQGVVPNTNITVIADCSKTPVGNSNNGNPTPTTTSIFLEIDLISRSADDKILGTYYENWTPVIGGTGADEGRYLAFVSQTAGIGGSTGKSRQIIWRDRKTGETRMISASPTGDEGNQNSLAPAISGDGKSVAFESYATNLISGDTNGRRDVFVWRANTGKVERVSTGQGGVEPDYESYEPTISGDGSLIAFTSNATNIIPNIQGISSYNIYLKDMRSGAVQIISLDEKTKKGGGGSNPSISEDGSRIAFYNYAPLTSDDKNTLWDIYVWQRGNPKLKRVSLTSERSERDQGSESASRVISPAISGDGRFVTFATTAKNMVGGDTNGVQDVFVADIDSGRVSRLSLGIDGQEPDSDSPIGQGEKISITYDGSWVVFSSNAKNLGGNILLKNVQTGETKIISTSQGINVARPDISRNGTYIVFGTSQQLDTKFKSSGIFVRFSGLN